MKRSRIMAAVVAVIGVLVVALADDVRSWRDTFRDNGLGYSVSPARQERLSAPTVLPAIVSGRLLSVGLDREWLRALPLFTRVYRETWTLEGLGPSSYDSLNKGRAALSKVTQDPDPVRASQAYNLLAVLTFREAHPDNAVDPVLLRETVTDLQNAVRLDGANELAKANLELVFRVVRAAPGARVQLPTIGSRKTTKRKGAYGGQPGTGY